MSYLLANLIKALCSLLDFFGTTSACLAVFVALVLAELVEGVSTATFTEAARPHFLKEALAVAERSKDSSQTLDHVAGQGYGIAEVASAREFTRIIPSLGKA